MSAAHIHSRSPVQHSSNRLKTNAWTLAIVAVVVLGLVSLSREGKVHDATASAIAWAGGIEGAAPADDAVYLPSRYASSEGSGPKTIARFERH